MTCKCLWAEGGSQSCGGAGRTPVAVTLGWVFTKDEGRWDFLLGQHCARTSLPSLTKGLGTCGDLSPSQLFWAQEATVKAIDCEQAPHSKSPFGISSLGSQEEVLSWGIPPGKSCQSAITQFGVGKTARVRRSSGSVMPRLGKTSDAFLYCFSPLLLLREGLLLPSYKLL